MSSQTKRANAIVIISLITALIAVALSFYLYLSSPKIAYVQNERLLSEYNGIKEARQMYQAKLDVWQSNLDTLKQELQQDINNYQSEYPNLSSKERELKEQLLQQKENNYLQYKKAVEQKAQEEDQQLSQEVLNQIDSYITEYGKEHGYDYIIGATSTGNLLYAKEKKDITEELLNELNAQYEGK